MAGGGSNLVRFRHTMLKPVGRRVMASSIEASWNATATTRSDARWSATLPPRANTGSPSSGANVTTGDGTMGDGASRGAFAGRIRKKAVPHTPTAATVRKPTVILTLHR